MNTILRIQHKDTEKGIYNMSGSDMRIYDLLSKCYTGVNHPAPRNDSLLKENVLNYYRSITDFSVVEQLEKFNTFPIHLLYGFIDKTQLFKWFYDYGDMGIFKNAGFHLVEMVGTILKGTTQAVIIRSSTNIINAYDLVNFYTNYYEYFQTVQKGRKLM